VPSVTLKSGCTPGGGGGRRLAPLAGRLLALPVESNPVKNKQTEQRASKENLPTHWVGAAAAVVVAVTGAAAAVAVAAAAAVTASCCCCSYGGCKNNSMFFFKYF
jgi:hypothetical protein